MEEQRKDADRKENAARTEQMDLKSEVDDDDLRELSM